MPDYNKGDFTQQGIDGFVEGGLHLNEKRCLTARISTDEETAGLDSVEINIHDHLNDLDYTFSGENVIAGTSVIGQAPSGNIEITENTAEGEPLNIAQYATATVNVSAMDTAEVTISNLAPSTLNLFLITITEYGMELFNDSIASNNENSYVLPLYQGAIALDCATCFPGVSLADIHVTGDITLNSDDEIITITGDGTIDIGVR